MARQPLDFTTVQPNGKIGDLAPAAFHKIDENFEELYNSWTNLKNKILTTDAEGKPKFSDVANFALQLLGQTDASSVLTKLGVSDFTKTLLDDLNASAFLATLGAGATGKALFNSANQDSGRTALGLGSAALMSTVGTVISGGASGAIIQRGSNSNGEFTRFADGTMDVWMTKSLNASANGFVSQGVVLPAEFIDSNYTATSGLSGFQTGSSWVSLSIESKTKNSCTLFTNSGNNLTNQIFNIHLKGRWY